MKGQAVDYTAVGHMTFAKLRQLETQRQGSKDDRVRNVAVRLLCDNCHKPFTCMLHDYRLAFGLTCTMGCLKELERYAKRDITMEAHDKELG